MTFMLRRQTSEHWLFLRQAAESVRGGTLNVYGLVFEANGWITTSMSRSPEGGIILQSALIVASSLLHLSKCIGLRFCRGVPKLSSLKGVAEAETPIWQPSMLSGEFPHQLYLATGEAALHTKEFALQYVEEKPPNEP